MGLMPGGLSGAEASPSFRVNPLAGAPSASYGTAGTAPLVQPPGTTDPRIRQLTDWLRAKVGQTAGPIPAAGAAADTRRRALARLQAAAGEGLEVRFRTPSNTPMLLRGALQSPAGGIALAGLAGDPDERTARAFLKEHRQLLRIQNPDAEFRLVENRKDELGRRHLRFAQYYQELSVWPCELLVHLDPSGAVDLFNGAYIASPADVLVQPVLREQDAAPAVLETYPGLAAGRFTEPELIIYGPIDGAPRLAWKLEVHLDLTSAWRMIVDALDGSILTRTSLVHDAAVSGSGVDSRGVNRPLQLWQEGASYYLVDASKPMFDPASTPPNGGRGTIEIYDAANKEVQDTQFSAGLIKSSSPTSGWDPDAVGAAFGLAQTYDYYRERFQRNSLNGAGGVIRALVRYGNNVANAFWYGTTKTMVFGAGFTREIDISGHELTHGVIDSVGNGGILEYRHQSGALNEALADIFGEMVEARFKNSMPDWLKADPFDPTNRDKLLQDYANPTSVSQMQGRPNPSKMSQLVQLTIEQDNGGVHINSSIINHCFYLLAVGLDGAPGLRDAEQIFYRAMTTQLQKQSQFIDMRLGSVISAEELFGKDSTQARKTREAFDRVELFDAPNTPDPTPIPTINAPDSTLFLRYDPFFDGIILGRREQAAGDPQDGVMLDTQDFVSAKRISVSGDGSFAVFVTADSDIGFIRTDGTAVSFADLSGSIHAVAMAPNGTRFAVVLLDPATGSPDNQIIVVDLSSGTEQAIKLLAPVADGTAQDIVEYADSIDFRPDSDGLIYDAVSLIPRSGGGNFEGWALFSLDLATERIATVINLNEGLDFGNPSLGNSRPYLLTHEVIDKRTGLSTIYAADLRTGEAKRIATLAQANLVGFPVYAGDDKAIIYTQADPGVPTSVSLLRQALADDGITPVGQPTLWLADADYAAIYRRGTFIAANALPQVGIASPTSAQTFPVPSSFDVLATATDPDGTIVKVGFYLGSTLVSEDTTAPYTVNLQVESAPSGGLRVTARAIDNLGGEADSAPVDLKFEAVTPTPVVITAQPQSQTVLEGGAVTFTVAASGGRGPLTFRWQRNGVDLGIGAPTLQLADVVLGAAGSYRVVVSDGVDAVTSTAATLTVTPKGVPGDVRLSARSLTGGLLQLHITGGKLNDVLRVQTSPNLKDWSTIATLVKTADSVSTIDADSVGVRVRFYRVAIGAN